MYVSAHVPEHAPQHALPEGVRVHYETGDVGELLHLLDFIVVYHERMEGKIHLLPLVTFNKKILDAEFLRRELFLVETGSRALNGEVVVYFLNMMRSVFYEYLTGMEKEVAEAKKEFSWDADHPLAEAFPVYKYAQENFFPDRRLAH